MPFANKGEANASSSKRGAIKGILNLKQKKVDSQASSQLAINSLHDRLLTVACHCAVICKHNWQMYNSCTYNVYGVQVLNVSFWHALLLLAEKQQAHGMAHRPVHVHAHVTSKIPCPAVAASRIGQGHRESGSSTCCSPCKPVKFVPSTTAAAAHPHQVRAQMPPYAACFVLLVTTWQSQAVCVQPNMLPVWFAAAWAMGS